MNKIQPVHELVKENSKINSFEDHILDVYTCKIFIFNRLQVYNYL